MAWEPVPLRFTPAAPAGKDGGKDCSQMGCRAGRSLTLRCSSMGVASTRPWRIRLDRTEFSFPSLDTKGAAIVAGGETPDQSQIR